MPKVRQLEASEIVGDRVVLDLAHDPVGLGNQEHPFGLRPEASLFESTAEHRFSLEPHREVGPAVFEGVELAVQLVEVALVHGAQMDTVIAEQHRSSRRRS